MIAIAFSCGLGLGVILGAALWSGALYLSKLALEKKIRNESAAYRQEAVMQQKRIEKAKERIRMEYGDQMTKEQEIIMEQELSKVGKSFPNPNVRQGA